MRIICLILLVFSIIGCSVSKKTMIGEEVSGVDSNKKISAEAFLYDAKYYDNNKPRSFRLQIFRTDSIIAFTGNGYLGKGVLRGTLTSDSLKAYFPTEDEYYYRDVDLIFKQSECNISDDDFDLSALFDFYKIMKLNNAIYEISETDNNRKKIVINPKKCSWDIEIEYKNYDSDLRPYLFSYTNKDNRKISAKLRKFKKSANVKLNLFKMPVLEKVSEVNALDGLVN
ncbi:MAG: hypothetical protein DRP35_02940 [Candidatus Zixiibacteriota bacterium]|nr:MAG: hypothetical protein DRP35_02940 [candidate division Zixibacteria bacterium]